MKNTSLIGTMELPKKEDSEDILCKGNNPSAKMKIVRRKNAAKVVKENYFLVGSINIGR